MIDYSLFYTLYIVSHINVNITECNIQLNIVKKHGGKIDIEVGFKFKR